MKFTHSALPLLFLASLGCAAEKSDTSEEPDQSDIVEYYEAHSEGLYRGTEAFSSHMAGRRTLQPSTSTIAETFIDLTDGDTHHVNADVNLEDGTFTLTIDYEEGSYEGTGALYGEAWDWHAWESTSVAPDGTSVVSEDTKDENGIVANKTGYTAEGEEEWSLVETLTPITEAEWLALQE